MSKYLETKKGSLEDMVAGVTEGKQSEDYKQLFKKELEKAGKGIGAMSDQEKKAFFNNIDKKHKAKNEGDPISKKMNQRQKNTPGEGTGAAVVDNPRRMKDPVHKESVELDESVKVEGGPPADGGPGSGAHNHGKSSSASPKKSSVPSALRNKDGKPSMGKLKNAIDDVNNTRSMAGNKFDITDIEYREKNGKKYLDLEVQEPEKLKKAMQAKYGKSVKFNIEPDTGNAEVYFEELQEGGVKDFLMDVEADAGDMSLNDLIKKYYGQMGLSAQEIKKIYYRVNETVNEEEEKETEEVKSLRDTVHDIWNQAAKDEEQREDDAKWLKTEEKKSITEEQIKCPNCGHMNDAGADKCSNCGYDLSKKEGKHGKKKAMTGSPATKVDVKPEVEFDSK